MRSASFNKKLRLFTLSLPSLELTALKNLKENLYFKMLVIKNLGIL